MNVISIVLDTFRSDIIGQGKKLSFVETPNLDALADESVVFDNAFGEGQPTLQIRRAFFTGCRSFPFVYNFDRRGHWHHAPGWHKIPPHQDTIAEILTARGYYTGLISDVYHTFKPTMNYSRGFSSYEFIRGQETDNWKGGTPDMIAEQMRRHTRTPEDPTSHIVLYQYLLNQRFRQGEEDYQCARVFRAASDWLDDNAANKPFFLWVEAFDPHEPWDPPPRYADKYCPDYDGLDFIMPGDLGENPTTAEIERTKALYYGEVTFLDRWVGVLLDKIDELGLKDDTLILVLSDHGTEVWDHGRLGKGSGNMRAHDTGIAWQMRAPTLAPARVGSLVQSHDVMPTILDMLDVPYSRTDGSSVLPLVRGETDTHRSPIVIGWCAFCVGNAAAFASVRTEKWNYVTCVHEDERPDLLFDLETDPEETHNVLAEHEDVARELRREVEAVVGQPLPAKMNEVCDPEDAPLGNYLLARTRI